MTSLWHSRLHDYWEDVGILQRQEEAGGIGR